MYFTGDALPTQLIREQPITILMMKQSLIQYGIAEENSNKYIEAYTRVLNDPRGEYKFGDTFIIPVSSCNVIEFEIDANGQAWTFNSNQARVSW